MKPSLARILTVNGGSSSIKFALFEANGGLKRLLDGQIERIGTGSASMSAKGQETSDNFSADLCARSQRGRAGAHGLAGGAAWA